MTALPCTASLTPVPSLEDLVARDKEHDCDGFGPHAVCVKVEAVADLPTRFGRFRIVAFWNNRDGKEHIAVARAAVEGAVAGEVPADELAGGRRGRLRAGATADRADLRVLAREPLPVARDRGGPARRGGRAAERVAPPARAGDRPRARRQRLAAPQPNGHRFVHRTAHRPPPLRRPLCRRFADAARSGARRARRQSATPRSAATTGLACSWIRGAVSARAAPPPAPAARPRGFSCRSCPW